MRNTLRLVALVAVLGCAHGAGDGSEATDATDATDERDAEPMTSREAASIAPTPAPAVPSGLRDAHAAVRVPGLELRTFDHAELWSALPPILEGSTRLRVEEVGRSVENRPIRSVSFGEGPVRVLMWSQMHGDESTATMALADIYAFVEREADHPVARAILENLTVTTIPMLNPDGAQRFQRRNAYGIDINRDARALATPEGRTLKRVYDEMRPQFAFNLHDQDVGTRVGRTDAGVAIALLSPAFDESREVNDVRLGAMRVAAAFRQAVEPLVGGHIARYDDSFNPRAFGDLTTTWGASAVLVESGGWRDDPEKQYLRMVNFVGLLAALNAIADGSYTRFDERLYSELPSNGRTLPDLLVRGGYLVVPGLEPVRADLMIEYRDPVRRRDGFIIEVGDLGGRDAIDTLDVDGLYVVAAAEALELSHGPQVGPGSPARFHVARTTDGPALWSFEGGPPPE
ncbi:MAG TPA: M14 family zinc carboxypeptidase [Longimicrobiales bacterium]|nr:M14 family zinc carboxypeptidase [Longimicrobiales bacterium]